MTDGEQFGTNPTLRVTCKVARTNKVNTLVPKQVGSYSWRGYEYELQDTNLIMCGSV